jgi:hypothetical protein
MRAILNIRGCPRATPCGRTCCIAVPEHKGPFYRLASDAAFGISKGFTK